MKKQQSKMSVEMWILVLITSLWTKNVFCFEFNLDDEISQSITKDDLDVTGPFGMESNGNLVEVKGIYYTSGSKPRVYVEYPNQDEFFTMETTDEGSNENEDNSFQPWSILWYIGSFGGLIAFFLIVSCSEWCCRTRLRNRNSQTVAPTSPTPSELPPPAYDLFAPPSYDSLCQPSSEKREYDVYVVPIHTLEVLRDSQLVINETNDSPPSYSFQTNEEPALNVQTTEESERTHKLEIDNLTQA